jgi:hypothetical protein
MTTFDDNALQMLTPDDPRRGAVESLIVETYARIYGAHLDRVIGRLVCLADAAGMPIAAAALRDENSGYFCDNYLERPLGSVLPGSGVEVCNLAGAARGAGCALIDKVIRHSLGAGAQWAAFTAIAPLRRLLTRRGLPFEVVVEARPERVTSAEMWGRYYQFDPRVCVVRRPALEGLQNG